MNNKTKALSIMATTLTIVFSLLVLFPFIMMLSTSLKTPIELMSGEFNLIPESWAFKNYITAFETGMWARWFFNSLFITVVVTVLSLIFNSLAGFAFARLDFKGKNVLFVLLLLGLMVPIHVIIVPEFVIMKNFPFVGGNNWLGEGGTGFINTYLALMLPQLAGAFGVFLCRQFFMNFPKSLDEAAMLDGASTLRLYAQIYLPLSMPLIATLGTLKFTGVYNDYLWPLIVTQVESMKTVQLGLTMFKHDVVEWELLMAATAVTMIPTLMVYFIAQRFFVEGLASASVKG